jgi:hypothetical protein
MNLLNVLDVIINVGSLATLVVGIQTFRRSIRVNKDSNYIRAESTSNEVFKMVIEHPELNNLYTDSDSMKISEVSEELKIKMKEYATILLNLFEVQFQLRKSKSISAVRFASWAPWIILLINGHFFKIVWANDLRMHYVPEFRALIDELTNASNPDGQHLYAIISKHCDNCKIIANWKNS